MLILLNYVPYVLSCLMSCRASRVSCLRFSCVLRALSPTCSRASRAFCSTCYWPHVPCALCDLEPHVLGALRAFVPYVSSALRALVLHMLLVPLALCPSCVNITFSALVFPNFTWLFLIHFQLVSFFESLWQFKWVGLKINVGNILKWRSTLTSNLCVWITVYLEK